MKRRIPKRLWPNRNILTKTKRPTPLSRKTRSGKSRNSAMLPKKTSNIMNAGRKSMANKRPTRKRSNRSRNAKGLLSHRGSTSLLPISNRPVSRNRWIHHPGISHQRSPGPLHPKRWFLGKSPNANTSRKQGKICSATTKPPSITKTPGNANRWKTDRRHNGKSKLKLRKDAIPGKQQPPFFLNPLPRRRAGCAGAALFCASLGIL